MFIGFLQETDRLPVIMLTFKKSGNRSFFTVGNLECQYNSRALPHNFSKIRVLKACTPLNQKPTSRTTKTIPPLNQKETIWKLRRQPHKPYDYNRNHKPTPRDVIPVVPKVNVNLTLEIPKLNQRNDKSHDGLKFTLSVYAVIVIAVATVIVVIIIAIVVIAKRCHHSSSGSSSGSRRRRNRHDSSMDSDDEEREERTEMCTFFGSFSRGAASDRNRPVIEVHRHSIHCDTLDELPPAYREYADYANQPITTHIDLSYKPRKKSFGFFC